MSQAEENECYAYLINVDIMSYLITSHTYRQCQQNTFEILISG